MAVVTVRPRSALGSDLVLAPERFDPRRTATWAGSGPLLETIADLANRTLRPRQAKEPEQRILVLDTTDARRGLVEPRHGPMLVAELGSTKKLARPGDVLVSRLRPYLQQVAYVDEAVPGLCGAVVACSSEFYVLRGRGAGSIAFVVPFLLSSAVQSILAAAQEGGHHPRFAASALMSLPVPQELLVARERLSREVEAAIALRRRAGVALEGLIDSAARVLSPRVPAAGGPRTGTAGPFASFRRR